jgi:hypothetical protein
MSEGRAVREEAAEPSSRRGIGDPNTEWTVVSLVVFGVLLFVLVVWLQSFYYRVENEELQSKVVAEAPEDLAKVRADEEAQLAGYRWVDQEHGVVAIPIDRAMDLLVKQLGSGASSGTDAGAHR